MTLLQAERLSAGYHGAPAIRDIDLYVAPAEMVLLAGPNGAGKSTTVMTLAGAIKPLAGTVLADGAATHEPVHRRCRSGLGLVTEERPIFPGLSVAENLRLGQGDPALALEFFPELGKRLKIAAGLLSGGEQQMLALGRVLAARPKVILADELSLGLAPIVVSRLLAALREAANAGAGVLLVEQHVRLALRVVDRVYLMRRGRIDASGTAAQIQADEAALRSLYL